MGSDRREALNRRALGAILQDAFFTWPSAVTIAFSIAMAALNVQVFEGWQPWFWLVFGGIAEAIYLWATVTDPAAQQQAVRRMLMDKYDPNDIRNSLARQRLLTALEYKRNIDAFVARQQSGAFKAMLSQNADEINEMLGYIYQLGKNVDEYESNKLVEQNRRSVPTDIANLKNRLKIEQDPGVRKDIEDGIRTREELLANIQTIISAAKRSELGMDNAVAQINTIYSQMQVMNTRNIDNASAQRMRDNIRDQIVELKDTIHAMDDVYSNTQTDYSAIAERLRTEDQPTTDAAADTAASDASTAPPAAEQQRRAQGRD